MSGGDRLLVADLRAVAPRWAFPAWAEARLHDEAPGGWRVHVMRTPADSDGDGGGAPAPELLQAVRDAEAYAGFGIAPAVFRAAPALRWVHSATAGVGSTLFAEMRDSDIVLTNSAGVHAVPIAEHVVGGILHFLRSFDIALAAQREARWDRVPFVGEESTVRELADCTVLVVGAGGVGSAIAERLSTLGCRCTGVRRRPELGVPPGFTRVVGPSGWRALLPDTTVLVLAAPATPDTRHLVTEQELGSLSRDGIVVNVARGSLLDEGALAQALGTGRIRGAMLDVFAQEPLAPESPLWGLRNLLLTPHVSGVTSGRFWKREMDLLIENWHRWATGRALRNVVDKRAGY